MNKFDVVFFDLDGTLVDTAPDLAYALNQLLKEQGKDPIDYDIIRPIASDGTAALLELGFGIREDDEAFIGLQKRYLELYRSNITRYSTLFDGMDNILDTLDDHQVPWGVITNKPARLTGPLLKELELDHRAICVVSGDTTGHSKPHPAPMLHACTRANVSPENCLYIGDAKRDIEAGQNVKMQTVAAAYGYIHDHDDPTHWQADAIISSPAELAEWICS